jgi:hypothetical protein
MFMKLPSKRHMPDYYAVIKKPIDLQTIGEKIDGEYQEYA